MRVVCDYGSLFQGSPSIIQVEKTPDKYAPTPMTGKYCVTFPDGITPEINTSSYVLPVDGGDVTSLLYAELLLRYPMYQNSYFNPLLIDNHVVELDTTASASITIGLNTYTTRAQTGRILSGNAPSMTALLPINTAVSPNRPGCLITNFVDITVPTGGLGADNFVVYWKIHRFLTSADVNASYGVHTGLNVAAEKYIEEVDPDFLGLQVYLANDATLTNWQQASYLKPVSFAGKGTKFRLAFLSNSFDKVYLATYGVLF